MSRCDRPHTAPYADTRVSMAVSGVLTPKARFRSHPSPLSRAHSRGLGPPSYPYMSRNPCAARAARNPRGRRPRSVSWPALRRALRAGALRAVRAGWRSAALRLCEEERPAGGYTGGGRGGGGRRGHPITKILLWKPFVLHVTEWYLESLPLRSSEATKE